MKIAGSGTELTAQRYALQSLHNLPEQLGIRITFRKGDPYAAYTDPDVCANLEQLQANGIALRPGQGRTFQSQTPQGLHQHIGE
jgi:hypothetical protein